MQPLGITRSQWWVLTCLSQRDGMMQSDLAKALALGKPALCGLIDRLEGSDFIERRADATDRRVKRLYLLSAGNAILKDTDRQICALNERILSGIDTRDRHQFADMLALIKRNLITLRWESGEDFECR